MEILIDIPPWLQPLWTILVQAWGYGTVAWQSSGQGVVWLRQAVIAAAWRDWPYSNVVLPITAVLLVFWPILWSLALAIVSAWAWIFWIVTSIILGLVQVGYATYQFAMISLDICGLSILKTYTIVRNQFLYYLHYGSRRKSSRRRLWRQKLDQADSYEAFLKIRIEPKDTTGMVPSTTSSLRRTWSFTGSSNRTDIATEAASSSSPVDGALPPRSLSSQGRSFSFSGLSATTLPTKDHPDSAPNHATVRNHHPRHRSFTGATSTEEHDSDAVHAAHLIDPLVSLELGRSTADLLVTTTSRLEQARLACVAQPHNAQAYSVLQYLLAGVVKRNHLQLDDVVIQNARSVAESGQYGLSTPTRHVLRAYYHQVELCLDVLADAETVTVSNHPATGNMPPLDRALELADRVTFLRKMKQNMGRTALMLSGGTFRVLLAV
jgi:hypothetical protein